MRAWRWRGILLGLAVVAIPGGCADDAGPGRVRITFESPILTVGAAVVDLSGPGLGTVVGAPGTRAFESAPEASTVRVLATSLTAAPPVFYVEVDDVGRGLPTAVLIRSVDTDNRVLVSTAQVQVRMELER